MNLPLCGSLWGLEKLKSFFTQFFGGEFRFGCRQLIKVTAVRVQEMRISRLVVLAWCPESVLLVLLNCQVGVSKGHQVSTTKKTTKGQRWETTFSPTHKIKSMKIPPTPPHIPPTKPPENPATQYFTHQVARELLHRDVYEKMPAIMGCLMDPPTKKKNIKFHQGPLM